SFSVHGELSLDGRIRPIRGVIVHAIGAVTRSLSKIIVPLENIGEASLVQGVSSLSAGSLTELIGCLNGKVQFQLAKPQPLDSTPEASSYVLDDVIGQESAKRALIIAAAGGHNLLMIGPPGCGKSMLAKRFVSLLPSLSEKEVIEVVKVHSVSGSALQQFLRGVRPFRSPHHHISDAGLIGGGSNPRPGEISMAHRGVLFLDEFPEFRRSAIEALRAPLETGQVSIARAKEVATFPASFQLIAAMNPCPCGNLGVKVAERARVCLCTRTAIDSYLKKLSQPILDRIDLQVELEPVALTELTAGNGHRESACHVHLEAKGVIGKARALQIERQGGLNSGLDSKQLGVRTTLDAKAKQLLERAAAKVGLSARGYVRTLRVAATIADLQESPEIASPHIAEALSFRGLERVRAFVDGY
ncbi:MAG: magnesium chelatase, partial [Proteobacteria bacterium]